MFFFSRDGSLNVTKISSKCPSSGIFFSRPRISRMDDRGLGKMRERKGKSMMETRRASHLSIIRVMLCRERRKEQPSIARLASADLICTTELILMLMLNPLDATARVGTKKIALRVSERGTNRQKKEKRIRSLLWKLSG